MTATPILDTIRALLTFRDGTTISEIAKMAGVSPRRVLDVVNANGALVYRLRKTGKITKVDTKTPLAKQLWASGAYYKIGSEGMWSHEYDTIVLVGHDDLAERLSTKQVLGALGDSTNRRFIVATPENIAAVEAAGIRPWSEAPSDDRLWSEE
ncbi:hypothetical protein [Acuticoccus sediminis]|uniref:hypothetical protein n=1 Tax=Acuticoccus sediminis TaxID=2184697 RepID=UPI001CFD1BC0|nr:hypothetical protein [Acuticoccus sediminis]